MRWLVLLSVMLCGAARADAIDISVVNELIAEQVYAITLVATACLAVWVGIGALRWIRRELS